MTFDAVHDLIPEGGLPVGMFRAAFYVAEDGVMHTNWTTDGDIETDRMVGCLEQAKLMYALAAIEEE